MAHRGNPGPRFGVAPPLRQTCAVCGKENVAHTEDGRPFRVHLRTRAHIAAEIAALEADLGIANREPSR